MLNNFKFTNTGINLMANNDFHKDLNKDNIKLLEELFNIKANCEETSCNMLIPVDKSHSTISLEIFFEENKENLISLYTNNTHLQLQGCSHFIISEMLEEVIFFSRSGDKISGMIVSKKGDCALYANVDKSTLSADFMNLPSEKLLSAVALSIIESI